MNTRVIRHLPLVVALAALCLASSSYADDGALRPLHVPLSPDLVQVAGGGLHGPAIRPDAEADKAWQTLLADDFEGAFPGDDWTVLANAGYPYWGRWDCWSGDTPTHSAGCAAAGPGAIACNGDYASGMYTWMVAGPFDFSDAATTAVELSAVVEVLAATPGDYAYVGVSRDLYGEGFFGWSLGGMVFGQDLALDLTDVTGFGSVVGEAQVWIGFLFVSNTDYFNFVNGFQVDDVLLRVERPLPNQEPLVHLVAPNGGEQLMAGAQRTITWTASDADGGPQPLSIDLEYSLGDGSWHGIATALGNTGSHVWTVPAQASTNVRVRVWADDGEDRVGDMSDASFAIVVPGENVLDVGDGAGPSGGSVVLSISLDNEDPVKGIQFDLVYSGALASFGSVAPSGRGAGMTARGANIGPGRARLLLFHDGAQVLAAGAGVVAQVTLNLQGPGGTTQVTPEALVLAGPDAEPWLGTTQGGSVQVSGPTAAPVVQIAALKNPGRPGSLHVLVTVSGGSGNPPTVTAAGSPVGAGAMYQGQVHMATGTAQVIVRASDTNAIGTGTDQVTVDLTTGGGR